MASVRSPLLQKSSQRAKSSNTTEKAKTCIFRYFPICRWLPNYTGSNLVRDIIAGLTVGLMVIPQGLAYATIAGLPVQYGLYSAYMGCFVYCVFGGSKDITIGPTAIMSLMVANYAKGEPAYAIALTLFSGIIQLTLGLLRLGFVVRFISVPVISGFVSAAAITIGFTQVKNFLGLKKIPREFYDEVYETFNHIEETNPWDILMGCCCVILLLVAKRMNKINMCNDNDDMSSLQRVCKKFIWLVSISRNALTVLVAAMVVGAMEAMGVKSVFTMTHFVDAGIPHFKPPKLSFTLGNSTAVTPGKLLTDLGPGLAVVPLIGFLESIAIAKAFARKNRYTVDASQELVALGIANCLSSFVSSYPVTGSFSRTAVNAQSGVATPAGGIFTGAVVLLALGLLTKYFRYIPKASLAALIMTSVVTMIEYHILKNIWTVRRIDLLPLIITFFGCFYDIELGIMCGIGAALLILLYPIVWPPLVISTRGDLCVIKINGNLSYPGVEHLTSEVQAIALTAQQPSGILVEFSLVTSIDFTVTQTLLSSLEDLSNRGIPMFFSDVNDNVRNTMTNSGIDPGIINPGHDVLAESINNGLQIVEDRSN